MSFDFRNKPVLITGGLGFIGSNLAHALVRHGAKVTIVDSSIKDCGANLFNIDGIKDSIELRQIDLRDREAITEAVVGKEYIFNLAGQVSHIDSMLNPRLDLDLNVRSHLELLEACRLSNPNAAIVYSSTRQVYGRPVRLPVDENHLQRPVDVNGINKLTAEGYHLLYWRAHGLRCSILRLTNTYGPRQLIRHNRQGFIGWFFRQIMERSQIAIYGDGSQIRDLTFVEDVVEALCLAAASNNAVGEIFNLGGAESISLRALVELMIQVRGGGSYNFVDFPNEKKRIDIGDYIADYSKIRRILGWVPRIDIKEGIRRTIDYYQDYLSYYL